MSLSTKVDKANVDTSTFVEPSSRWIQALEAWACSQLWIKSKDFDIVKIGVEEGVHLGSGIRDSLHLNVVL